MYDNMLVYVKICRDLRLVINIFYLLNLWTYDFKLLWSSKTGLIFGGHYFLNSSKYLYTTLNINLSPHLKFCSSLS